MLLNVVYQGAHDVLKKYVHVWWNLHRSVLVLFVVLQALTEKE